MKKVKLLVVAAVLIFTFWNVAQFAIPRPFMNHTSDLESVHITYSEMNVSNSRNREFNIKSDDSRFQRIVEKLNGKMYYRDFNSKQGMSITGEYDSVYLNFGGFSLNLYTDSATILLNGYTHRMASRHQVNELIDDIKAILGI
jgi:hypothetical protein